MAAYGENEMAVDSPRAMRNSGSLQPNFTDPAEKELLCERKS